MKDLVLLLTVVILSRVKGETMDNGFCISKDCFATSRKIANFTTALTRCQEKSGHLVTLHSKISHDALAILLNNNTGDFWIGLKFSKSGCTDVTTGLRGYEWITGAGVHSDFTNWKSNETVCGPRCVSISKDLKWSERSCDDEIDGFLCGYSFGSMCEPLVPEGTDKTLSYHTLLGFQGEGFRSLPPGSIATARPSGIRHICLPENQWIRAPWSCEIAKGGCDHQCFQGGQCSCPPGQALERNNVSCANVSNDPCARAGCEHYCSPKNNSYECLCKPGFQLTEDGKKCKDIDDCLDARICQNLKCVNTIGSFVCKCHDGFQMVNNNCVDIDECSSMPCEHECINVPGSYNCSCFSGYIQRSDDFRKCELHCPFEECLAECDINDPNDCMCPEGFIKDERDKIYCVDINECDMYYCEQECKNTYGGYVCSCNEGYELIDGYDCRPYDTTTFSTDFVTPTSSYPSPAVTPGGLLGIIVCIVFMILILVFLVHQILKRRPQWNAASGHKNRGEDMQDLQQVRTEKYTQNSSFVNRDLKQDT
ncbi:thrombomodulin-like [Megalops cyprinoides]|uniref:thrombomodulin-like n=1 Tax=Megalops cyprinoides TaxID=118141 RepID=UPI0018647617|nr:thrombomodulin-like [Megalops cyprinoides]